MAKRLEAVAYRRIAVIDNGKLLMDNGDFLRV
jgi:hypothetical protein